MNRYVEQGIVKDAESGRSVVVIGRRRAEVRASFEGIAANTNGCRVYRANGAERIDFASGGSIRFVGGGTTLRGMSADVVFVDGWNELSEAQRHDIAPIALRELIRA